MCTGSLTRPGLPILVLSQYVEELYARELLADRSGAIGYLLKDRVSNNAQFLQAIDTVAGGGTVMDPQVIDKLLRRGEQRGRTATLTVRERDVLTAMAAGRSNASISELLHLSISAVTKHIASIFAKLELPASEDDNRRVLAVLAYLER
jgi:DNA-binding NarL/FixJ family response regulator